jgi:ribose transport system substrate-binding protein
MKNSAPRRIAGVGVALLLTLVVTATAFGGATRQTKRAAEPVNVAFLIATTSAGYTRGILTAAKKAAAANDVKLTVFDAQFNPQKQFSQCQDVISGGKFQAIVTLPAASPAMVPCAKLAKQAGIPLITTNVAVGSDLSHYQPLVPGVTSQVLVPATVAWDAVRKPLLAACKAKGGGKNCHVGFIMGVKALALTGPASKTIHTWTKGMTFVGEAEGFYQRGGGLKVMQNLLQKDPELNILVSMSDDMALGAQAAAKAANKKFGTDILVITQGGSVPGVASLRAGTWYATTVSNAETEGRIPIELAAKAARGGKIVRSVDSTKAGGTPQVINKDVLKGLPKFKGTFPA